MRNYLVGAALALSLSFSASAQIANTKHNLGSTGTGDNRFSGTAEICVFCHTPHGANTDANVPLWNKNTNSGSYTTYSTLNSSTIEGAVATVGSVSIACMSCHDGTQAMDVILNEPGSGTDNAAFSAGTWTGNSTPQGITNLGVDLSNDHPVGIQYGGGGLTVSAPSGALRDPDFKPASSGTVNNTTVWWVDTEATPDSQRQKTDMILYNRSVADINGGAIQPFVECASCHDPHSANETFLRISNNNSDVCLACHSK